MSQHATPLNYATPMSRQRSLPPYFIWMVAIAMGFLGANGFADAAGFPQASSPERDPGYVFFRIICGIVVAGLTVGVLMAASHFASMLVSALSGVRTKPDVGVTITLIVSGAACLLGAVIIPFYFSHSSGASISVSSDGMSSAVHVQTPIIGIIGTIILLAVGVTLTGIGVWASLRPDEARGSAQPVSS